MNGQHCGTCTCEHVGFEVLSKRERLVSDGLIAGENVSAIAKRTGLSVKTISTYRARVFHKLGIKTLAALIHMHYAAANRE